MASSNPSSSRGTPSSPASSLARSAGRRVEVEGSDNPLLGSPEDSVMGSYPVYSARRRISSATPTPEDAPPLISAPASTSSPSISSPPPPPPAAPSYAPPVSNSSSTTSISTSRHVPPIPRTSSTPRMTFGAASSIDHQRKSSSSSAAEARDLLSTQSLKARTQSMGLANESVGAAMVLKLVTVGKELEWSGVVRALNGGKVGRSCIWSEGGNALTISVCLSVVRVGNSPTADGEAHCTVSDLPVVLWVLVELQLTLDRLEIGSS